MKSLILICFWAVAIESARCAPPPVVYSFSYKGVRIDEHFNVNVPFDIEFPRNQQELSAKEAIEKADAFLVRAFGKEFRAPIYRVSLSRQKSKKGDYFWTWQVCYFDPDRLDDSRRARLFYVYISPSGKPLMKILKDSGGDGVGK